MPHNLQSFKKLIQNEIFPQALDELDSCKTEEQAIKWRTDLSQIFNKLLFVGEYPILEEFKSGTPQDVHPLIRKVQHFIGQRPIAERRIQK